jgi:hypothetical protein
MDAFAAELAACLAELDRGEGGGDATAVVPAPRPRARPRRPVSRTPVGIMLLGVLAVAAIALGLLTLRGGGKQPPLGAPVALSGAGAYDPYRGDGEHDADAPKAVDGNRSTFWPTQNYNDAPSLGKPGVGLVLDAAGLVQLSQVIVVTDTPGFTAEIQATNTLGAPPTPVSASHVTGGTTRFEIKPGIGPKRFYIVWITRLPPGRNYAHVNEVRAFGR